MYPSVHADCQLVIYSSKEESMKMSLKLML